MLVNELYTAIFYIPLGMFFQTSQFLLFLNFLDRDRDIGKQQRQLTTGFFTGPVVSYQIMFCLDSCTPFVQFVSTSRRVSPFFSQYHQEDNITQLVGPLKTHLFAGYAQSSPFLILMVTSICCIDSFQNHFQQIHMRYIIRPINVKNAMEATVHKDLKFRGD